jgi:hypothetical protein
MDFSDYSSRFLAVLLTEFPSFQQHLTKGPEQGCFTIEFQAPSGSVFWINTEEEDRITIGFDAHHVHFGGWADSDDAQDFTHAISYIRGLISGQYDVVVCTRNGQFAGSVTVLRGERPAVWRDEEGVILDIKPWSCPGQEDIRR